MMSFISDRGQTTVEAAFLLPIFVLLLLLLCQPIILLYNRMVMQNAACEGCRLLMTRSVGESPYGVDAYEDYIKRRLGVIPSLSIFHIHDPDCSYEIKLEGDEASGNVKVSISNKVLLLPLIGQSAALLGKSESGGVYTQVVEVQLPSRQAWVRGTPDDWANSWEK